MVKHEEWRKVAKKMRRKKIRSQLAQKRDALEHEEEEKRKMSPNYEERVAEEQALRIATEEAEMKELEEKLRKWEEEEERVKEETTLRQMLLKDLEEQSEKRKLEQIEAERKIAEEADEKKRSVSDSLCKFAAGVIKTLPEGILVQTETQPGKEVCPFFHKVAACKFWDTCSRNHIRPSVSRILLFPGFYSHYSMSSIGHAEYDTDMSLEYDEKETYSHFLEFYEDIRSEFENYGRLTHLFVCANRESHLRGNVYASYATEQESMAAFLKFNGRYYGGRLISCQFVNIGSWRSAICGLYFKQKCPKGDACNFLHVFKDPGPPFFESDHDRSSSDEWRWSVSPELNSEEPSNESARRRRKRRKRNRSTERKRSRSRSTERKRSRSRSTERRRSRSRSTEHRRSCSRSTDYRRSRSSDRRSENSTRSLHSDSKENTGNHSITSNSYRKSSVDHKHKYSDKSDRRSRSKDRKRRRFYERSSEKSRSSEKRHRYNDKRRSRSPKRDSKQHRAKESTFDTSANRN